jgi:hypothetical protein
MWAVIKNYFQDYKIYANIIKMFIKEFLNNLPQPSTDNTWPKHPTNQNYRMWFKRQYESDYFLGIHDRI